MEGCPWDTAYNDLGKTRRVFDYSFLRIGDRMKAMEIGFIK
jgi:hypothetical protein